MMKYEAHVLSIRQKPGTRVGGDKTTQARIVADQTSFLQSTKDPPHILIIEG